MITMLQQAREQGIARLVAEAEARGANAIIAMRFDTSELGSSWTEICAYGTAVRVRPRAPDLARCSDHEPVRDD